MKKILISLLLALTTVLSVVPMLATAAGAEGGATQGGSAVTVLTPDELYVQGATVILSAFAGENNITQNSDGSATFTDSVTGKVFDLVGNRANIVGTYSYDHVGSTKENLPVAVSSQKIHYAKDGTTELYRATLTIYTDPDLKPDSYANYVVVADNGERAVACRSVLVIEARDASGAWSSDPEAAVYEMGGWTAGEHGGIGYILPDFFYGSVKSQHTLGNHYLELGADVLPEGEMTFEIVSSIVGAIDTDNYKSTLNKYTAYEGDGEWALGFRIGALNIVPRVTSEKSPDLKPGIGKVLLAYSASTGWANDLRFLNNSPTMSGATNGSTIVVTKDLIDSKYCYTIKMNGQRIASTTMGEKFTYIPNSELSDPAFRVANDLPETVYAVRVYPTALTEQQLAQNHFADLAKFHGLDLTGFSTVPAALRQSVYDNFVSFDFASDKGELQALLDETVEIVTYVPEMNQYDELYVKKGLQILLTAYDNSEKVISLVAGNEYWQNKIANQDGVYQKFALIGESKDFALFDDDGALIREGNTGWKKIEGGGIGYEATLKQLQDRLTNHIDLGIENLPNNHTVEMIFDAYGAYLDGTETYRSESNVAERWINLVTVGNVGIYSKHTVPWNSGLSVAPLDAFYNFFQQDAIWGGAGQKGLGNVSELAIDTRGILNLSVVREESGNRVTAGIKVYEEDDLFLTRVETLDMLSSRGSSFKLMNATPGAVYSVRVYDRLLTDDERRQNHFADLCAYYQLDLTNFYNTALLPESYRQTIYNEMKDIDFTMDRADVQNRLTSLIFTSILSFDGFTIRTAGSSEELSAIFTVNSQRIDALLDLGYTVTYGGLLADADVDLTDAVYNSTAEGVRVFYLFSNDGDLTANPVYVSESEAQKQFGLSVFYDTYTTPENYGKLYRFRSFFILEKGDEQLIAYVDAETDSLGSAVSHYTVAEHLTKLDKYHANEKLLDSMDRSFNHYDLYLDVKNGSDENSGSKNSPVSTLEKALELALELINSKAMPAVKIHMAGGKYELDETLTIDREMITAHSYRLVFEKAKDATEPPTVSSSFDVPGGEFALYDPEKNIYVYALPDSFKNENGKYPLFQNLYVDGKMATLAKTDWFTMTLDEYKTEGGYFTVWVPDTLLAGIVEKDQNGDYYLVGDHPDSMRWAARMQWYYYDLVIESVDIETSNTVESIPNLVKNGNYFENGRFSSSTEGYVALKFYSDHGTIFNNSHQSVGAFTAHDYKAKLTGSMAFLDEGGEFYYDQTIGVFYYIPTEGQTVSELTFSMPTLETLLCLEGVKNVIFDGITFTGTDSKFIPEYGFTGGQAGSQKKKINGKSFIHEAAIVGHNVSGITVKNCDFAELYYHGVDFYGIVNGVTVDSSSFTYTGGGAIQFGDGVYSSTDYNKNIRITNNYLRENGILFYNNCAMTLTSVINGKILHNSIIDSVYTGISVGWKWVQTTAPVGSDYNIWNCEIAYNYVENFMYMMMDGGAIYTLGGNAPLEYDVLVNEMHHNYVHAGSTTGHVTNERFSTALYHDGGSSHWHTHHNAIWVDQEILAQWDYITMQTGSSNPVQQSYRITAENNYFINLYQKYLTLGYQRVRPDWENYEINSYLLTTLDPSEFDDQYQSPPGKWHDVSKNPANWSFFADSGKLEELNTTMADSGCDLAGGIYKGAPLGDAAYDYNCRVLTQSETWYHPDIGNPDYLDK